MPSLDERDDVTRLKVTAETTRTTAGRAVLAAELRRPREVVLVSLVGQNGNVAALDGTGPGGPTGDDPAAGRLGNEISRDEHALLAALLRVRVPVVAALEGEVGGLRLALALVADVRVVDPRAQLVVDPVGTLGLHASGLPVMLRHRGSASDLLWTGASLTAQQACARGLTTEVGDAARAEDIVDRLVATPRAATSALKRSLTARNGVELMRDLVFDAWMECVTTSDASTARC